MDMMLGMKKNTKKAMKQAMKKVRNKVTKKARKMEGKRDTGKAILQGKLIHELAPCAQVEECKLIFHAMAKAVAYVEILVLRNVYIAMVEDLPIINTYIFMKEKHFDILAIYSTNTTLLIVPKTIVAKGTTVQVEKDSWEIVRVQPISHEPLFFAQKYKEK